MAGGADGRRAEGGLPDGDDAGVSVLVRGIRAASAGGDGMWVSGGVFENSLVARGVWGSGRVS